MDGRKRAYKSVLIMEFNSANTYRNLPIVALAGRPNVGKSTLFNRMLHKRRVITDPTPGVTRDPIEVDGFIAGKPLTLVDTGGFKLDRSYSPAGYRSAATESVNEIDELVVDKTIEIIKKADLIVLMFDAGEITAEDEEFIKLLRPYQKKLIAAVNKTEGGRQESDAWNIMSYGFNRVFMISAEHGDNVGELEQEIISRLDFSAVTEGVREKQPIRIALLGKPNTGKSTISNRLTLSNASIISDIPGTTRDVVEGSFKWKSHACIICDTAGIRRKSKVSENIEYYSVNRAIKTIDNVDIVFLIIDAEEGLSEQDKKIAALAHDKGRGIIMVLNKWDLIEQSGRGIVDAKYKFKTASERIHFLFGKMEYAPIIPVSAINGSGFDKLLNTALQMYSQLTAQVGTVKLNQALERWLEEYPPPIGPRTRFKIKYAVQSSANPVQFIIFVSRIYAVSESYLSYLRNKIRDELGFSMIPVSLELRKSEHRTQEQRISERRKPEPGKPEQEKPKHSKPKRQAVKQGSLPKDQRGKKRTRRKK